MLVCVDGTGASDTATYAHDFARSFVNRVKNEYLRAHPPPDPAPIHHRGPGDDFLDGVVGSFGGEHHVDPEFVVEEIVRLYRAVGDEVEALPSWALGQSPSAWAPEDVEQLRLIEQRRKIFMVGHSRGGAIVINAARIMRGRGLPVEAMFLFDAVARNPGLDADEIPSNVRHCYHAMRDPDGCSRLSFGNCGTTAASGVDFQPNPMRRFFTTHGGMGGTPWGAQPDHLTATGFISEGDPLGHTYITPEDEARGTQAVEAWMWPHLRRHGVVP